MSCDTATACNQMNELVAQIMATMPEVMIQWQGKGSEEPPAMDKRWIRVYVIHANGAQATLSDEQGRKKWSRNGSLIIQCFAPQDDGGLDVARAIATKLQDAIQNAQTAGGVWFRNVGIRESGRTQYWQQVNVNATFTYDSIN